MGKYITLHQTVADFNAKKDSFITPHVAYVVENNTVDYKPLVPPTPSHDYVEIGGIKWATMNIGATGITDTGLYFQWGDTQGYTAGQVGEGEGQKYFGWADYKYGNGTSSPGATGMTKYNSTDGKTVLDTEDDAVAVAWGGNWRMPTVFEYLALNGATTSAWTANYEGSGVAGVVLTSIADGATLFFPACGYADYGSMEFVGDNGYCWSSSLFDIGGYTNAYSLNLDSYDVGYDVGNYRSYGYPVRGVLGENS